MGRRTELHGELLELAPKAYYQPPTNIKMVYPCFVYDRSKIKAEYADNRIYQKYDCYSLKYISPTVADGKVDEILEHFKYCRFDRHYVADGLHHYIFDLFY